MHIQNLSDVELALQPYFVVAAETTGKDVTTQRTELLLAAIGNPQEKLRIVHLAGTSGKTSTAYFIDALLHTAGYKTGLTISPHIDSLTERVQICGKQLSEKQFSKYMNDFLEEIKNCSIVPSWFELMIAFSYWVFWKEKVDYAVIETGLGGLHDATNVVKRRDKLCVITEIGYDHMHILGNSLGAIAHQKAGIIQEGNTVLMYNQSTEIMQVVRYYVSQQEDAELLTFDQDRLRLAFKGQFIDHLAQFQQRNWLLAFATFKFLVQRDGLNDLSMHEYTKTMDLTVPARMEVTNFKGKTIVMDGAHNSQKMRAFVDSYIAEYGTQKPIVLLALKEGKEAAEIAPILAQITDRIIITQFEHAQDMPIVSQEPEKVAPAFSTFFETVEVEHDAEKGYERALAISNDIVITGSFYFIAQLRRMHKELQ